MSGLRVYLFAMVLFSFSGLILITAEKFKNKSLKKKYVHNEDLRETAKRVVKLALWMWLGFMIIFLIGYVFDGEPGPEDYPLILICLIAPLLYSFVVLLGYFFFLWGYVRLPIVNRAENESSDD